MSDSYQFPQALVSTDWLHSHLTDTGLKVFECTTYLDYLPPGQDAPYRVVSGRADYDTGHIAGAGFLDLQNQLSDTASPSHLRFTMLPPDALAERLGQHGIGDGNRVVLYARGRNVWATRVWWMLRALGFDNAAVLDGGWEKWAREGRPVSTDEPAASPALFTARPRPGLFVDKQVVAAAVGDREVCMINALEADLHRGDNARYGRPGRIPGSVNVPASSLVDPDSNTFIDAEQAAAAFRAAGAEPDGRTLLYCGGGIAATLDAFVLHQLGYRDISVYDASMSEWARDASLPMEKD